MPGAVVDDDARQLLDDAVGRGVVQHLVQQLQAPLRLHEVAILVRCKWSDCVSVADKDWAV